MSVAKLAEPREACDNSTGAVVRRGGYVAATPFEIRVQRDIGRHGLIGPDDTYQLLSMVEHERSRAEQLERELDQMRASYARYLSDVKALRATAADEQSRPCATEEGIEAMAGLVSVLRERDTLTARAERAEKEHREVIGHLDRLLTFCAGVGEAIAALGYTPGNAEQTLANVKSLVARAEQAERERDEWHQRANDEGAAVVRRDDEIERLELKLREARKVVEMSNYERRELAHSAKAEEAARKRVEAELEKARADNAELLAALRAARDPHEEEACEAGCRCDVEKLIRSPHPGAALLERLRALEKVREAVEPWRAAEAGLMSDEQDDESRALLDACAAADALKEAP